MGLVSGVFADGLAFGLALGLVWVIGGGEYAPGPFDGVGRTPVPVPGAFLNQ